MSFLTLFTTLTSSLLIGYADKSDFALQPYTFAAPKCPLKKGNCDPKALTVCLENPKFTPDGIEYLVPNGKDRLVWALLKYAAKAPIDPCTGKMKQE